MQGAQLSAFFYIWIMVDKYTSKKWANSVVTVVENGMPGIEAIEAYSLPETSKIREAYNVIETLQKETFEAVNKELEQKIRMAFEAKGFNFETLEAFYAFCKDRVTRVLTADDIYTLILDMGTSNPIEICKWHHKYDFSYADNTFTVVYNQVITK